MPKAIPPMSVLSELEATFATLVQPTTDAPGRVADVLALCSQAIRDAEACCGHKDVVAEDVTLAGRAVGAFLFQFEEKFLRYPPSALMAMRQAPNALPADLQHLLGRVLNRVGKLIGDKFATFAPPPPVEAEEDQDAGAEPPPPLVTEEAEPRKPNRKKKA